MLDDIREWISDNLRYILLGLAIILLIIIAVFAVRLVTHIGSGNSDKNTNQQQEQQTDAQTEEDTTSVSVSTETLTLNQSDLLELATSYWTAIGEQDFDALETLCGKTFDEDAQATVASMDVAVEEYSDFMTYSKSGLTDGSYVVYVYMELKLTGIDTKAPTLRQMYMQPDDDGTLLVVLTEDYTSEISAYISERQTDSDVQALIQDVSDTLTERCAADEDLATYIEERSTTSTDSNDGSDDDSAESSSDALLGTMQVSASTGVNVRSEASAESTKVGSLIAGSQVEVLENLDSGWSRISYIDSTGSTVEGYVKTEYLSAVN